jgi:predicted transcriptional regulator
MSGTMTIRLGGGIKNRLDQLASVTQRSKSFLAAEAIAAYVDTNEWQLAEIQAALAEADARDYATDQDIADLALKWNDAAQWYLHGVFA